MPGKTKSRTHSLPGVGRFGDLRADGFRWTRWDHDAPAGGRHWFEPEVLVVGLNVAGHGRLAADGDETAARAVEPGRCFVSLAGARRQFLECEQAGVHRFVTLEMRRPWLARWVSAEARELGGVTRRFLDPKGADHECEVRSMSAPLAQIANDVLRPPPAPAAWNCWHHAKALELVAHGLVSPAPTELFCERAKRLGRERVERVRAILRADVENPPGLAELGRRVGCSPFYLSRTFRQETGVTISAFLRRVRMERAAELLRAGEANVTEAALTVGYASLSHFSKAFSEAFGCCPCLYGRKPAPAAPRR